jgi:hypothetical protein
MPIVEISKILILEHFGIRISPFPSRVARAYTREGMSSDALAFQCGTIRKDVSFLQPIQEASRRELVKVLNLIKDYNKDDRL